MKLFINKENELCLSAETGDEKTTLIELFVGSTSKKETSTGKRTHKKHVYKKQCEYCGGHFKGKLGLAIHQSKCLNNQIVKEYDL